MNLTFSRKRKLVPNWRSVQDTINNGELECQSNSPRHVDNYSIEEYRSNWIENRTVPHCGEYISASISNCSPIDENLIEAAEFIVKNKTVFEDSPLRSLANNIIERSNNNETLMVPPITPELLTREKYKENIGVRIAILRKHITQYYRDAIAHIELSQLFLLNGNWYNAVKHAVIASQLAPDNRYITRCAVRCFTHVGDYDRAHHVLSHNVFLPKDPWLISSDISVDMLRGKNPRNYKKALSLKDNRNYSPISLTEMLMALATLESQKGSSLKQIKRLIAQSMIKPIDNSLAQAKWLSSKIPGIYIDETSIEVKFNYETATFDAFHEGDYERSFQSAFKWFKDSSFSRRATLMASKIATSYADHVEDGISILELGLIANPTSPELLNDLAYHLILSNKIEEGAKKIILADMQPSKNKETEICILATRGLLYFRQNHITEGREIYQEAIRRAKKEGKEHSYLANAAYINLTREEALAGFTTIEEATKKLNSIKTDDPDIQHDINRVKQLLEKRNESGRS